MSGSPARKVITIGVVIVIVTLLVPFSVSCSKPLPPTAAFTFNYVSGELLKQEDYITGTAPFTVRFTDQSSGEITSWKWNFGDGPAVEGGRELRSITHTYEAANSSGYIIVLTVRGPGGTRTKESDPGIVTVLGCSEAANSELNGAEAAVQSCLNAAGKSQLDVFDSAWDGSRGKVMAGGRDAADYLGVWKAFKATYNVTKDGTMTSGTDVSWHCVFWEASGRLGKGGWRELR
jgi:PKD repeat protein